MAETTFYSCELVVRGYHIYQEIWEASCGQTFLCLQEEGNAFDPFAVSVVRAGDIIGHVPKISAACSLFLRNRGSVQCTVTGSRQYSSDLPQGGLEVPCKLTFTGEKKYVMKIEKLLNPTTMSSASPAVIALTSSSTSSNAGSSLTSTDTRTSHSATDTRTSHSATDTGISHSSSSAGTSHTSNDTGTSQDVIAINDNSSVVSDNKKRKVVDDENVDEGGEGIGIWIQVHGS